MQDQDQGSESRIRITIKYQGWLQATFPGSAKRCDSQYYIQAIAFTSGEVPWLVLLSYQNNMYNSFLC